MATKTKPPFLAKLEVEAQPLADYAKVSITSEASVVVLISIAISAKRIADCLDHIVNYGIITGSE